ncbi:MAG: peptidoglycan-binding domain-containing protein, partial [Patescibacteria group bacterium]
KAGAVTIEELLAQIQALQAQLLVLQGQQGAPVAGACSFTRSLYVGVSSGADVKCLQKYLNSAGYPVAASGAGSVGNETMFYGQLTRAAVAKWQAAMSVLPAVGYFGPISRAKYSAVAGGGVVPPPGGGGVVTPPVAGGLSVSLSGSTPAARTIVASAALMPFGKWNFTAGSGDVTVTTLKFKRSGISSDSELSSAYLYDEEGNYLAQYSGLGSGVLTFTNSSGLFTVKAGTTKMVEMRVDVASSASNNHTMAWSLEAAADVTSNATSVSGGFPSMSNAMTFVTVSDPNIATLTATVVTTGNSVNAGTTGYLAGSFTLLAANSAVLINRIVLTQNGSLISSTDLGNIKLVTSGGKQMGATLPSLKSDGTGSFVMSPAYEIPAGQTIQVNVYADILAGVNRNLKFNVLNLRDIHATDKTYNVGVNPSASVTMTQ